MGLMLSVFFYEENKTRFLTFLSTLSICNHFVALPSAKSDLGTCYLKVPSLRRVCCTLISRWVPLMVRQNTKTRLKQGNPLSSRHERGMKQSEEKDTVQRKNTRLWHQFICWGRDWSTRGSTSHTLVSGVHSTTFLEKGRAAEYVTGMGTVRGRLVHKLFSINITIVVTFLISSLSLISLEAFVLSLAGGSIPRTPPP